MRRQHIESPFWYLIPITLIMVRQEVAFI